MKHLLVFCFATSIILAVSGQSNDELRIVVDREAQKFMSSEGAVGLAIGLYKNENGHVLLRDNR